MRTGACRSSCPRAAGRGMRATFGTARDVTVDELSIESFFPADDTTGAALRALWD